MKLFNEKILFTDGGMGTMLQAKGLAGGDIPEYLNIEHPDVISSIHEEYVLSGANVITTNTFGANLQKAKDWKYSLDEVISSAVAIAKNVAKKHNALVAFDIGPTGRLMQPIGDFTFDEAYDTFKTSAVLAEKAGADIVIIETMTDIAEARAAVLAVKENTSLPVFVTMTFDEKGKTLTGSDPEIVAITLGALGVDAVGANCGLGPEKIYDIAKRMHSVVSIPIMVQPNAGLPKIENGKTVFSMDADEFSYHMEKIAELGVSVMGGCCGTTPKYIKKTIEACGKYTPSIKEINETYVTSYCRMQELGKTPVIIGERINPTGKKKLKEALRNCDMNYIIGEATSQTDAGAHILDINAGLPEIDEAKVMVEVISTVSQYSPLPLQIDSTDPKVIERALRYYNGKAIVNSVCAKQEIMDELFPIVAKYGACVVGLTLNESGIPNEADGRVAIAEQIISEAQKYGIQKSDVIIDPLTMTVSTGNDAAKNTLKAVSKLKKLGIKTVLGVSNVSFGLPRREVITSVFFANALYAGLDACIINPCSEAMMNSYKSYMALAGLDEDCEGYISYFTEAVNHEAVGGLYDIIIRGFKDSAYAETVELLKTTKPMDIINNTIIPALDFVGGEFEKSRMFLPQLMSSATAVQNSFCAIKENIEATGEKSVSRGKIVLATVKGDIHDIGKNIVKVLLENYGYTVIDLGKDVYPDVIIDTLIKEDVHLLGLSALMTTTVVGMEDTINLIRQKGLDVCVMVGGAVLTQEYADMIGADAYTKDALATVDYANKFFS